MLQNQYLLTTSSTCDNAPGFVLEGNTILIYANHVPGTQPLDRYINKEVDYMYVKRD